MDQSQRAATRAAFEFERPDSGAPLIAVLEARLGERPRGMYPSAPRALGIQVKGVSRVHGEVL